MKTRLRGIPNCCNKDNFKLFSAKLVSTSNTYFKIGAANMPIMVGIARTTIPPAMAGRRMHI